jgi:dTDP-glucose 4,6-dehydratase
MAAAEKNNLKYKNIVLITGGCGFIGSNYLNRFVPKKPSTLFINLDVMTYAASKKNILVGKFANYIHKKIDIRNKKDLYQLFKILPPDGIIHFAAESHVDLSIKNPGIFVETNVIGTANLLSLAVEFKIKRFLQVSTDEVYGSLSKKEAPFTEKSPLLPNSPYSASKAAAELLVRSYWKTFNLNVLTTRCSNNYGPNQDKTKLIPKFITRLLENKKIPLYAKGDNIRDWIFVQDHVDAIDLVFEKGKNGETYNIGGDCEMTNMEITKTLLQSMNKNKSMIEYVADRPGHDFRYALDFSKIKKDLGWSPKISFEKGISETIEFYKRTNKYF